MLVSPSKYENELKQKFEDTWYDLKYQYYHASRWHRGFSLPTTDGDWEYINFASVDKDEKLIGYIKLMIHRTTNRVEELGIINFGGSDVIFAYDVVQAVTDVFEKYHFRKLNFTVICGNPAEDAYDRLIKRCGGRIVGIYKEHVFLMDGSYHDQKQYEILEKDFLETRRKKNGKSK